MDDLIYLFAAVVVIASALSGLAIRTAPALWLKTAALVLSALLMLTAYGSLTDLLGKPKGISLEWARRNVPEATVLSVSMNEDHAIYVWLQFDDDPEPRAYALPWSLSRAKELQEAMEYGKAWGTKVRMRRPFGKDIGKHDPMFYAEPQPPLPPKHGYTG